MKRVFTAPTITEAHLVRGILEKAGIEAVVQKEHLSGLAGGVPFMEAWPEVWVVNDLDENRARTVISQYLKT